MQARLAAGSESARVNSIDIELDREQMKQEVEIGNEIQAQSVLFCVTVNSNRAEPRFSRLHCFDSEESRDETSIPALRHDRRDEESRFRARMRSCHSGRCDDGLP